MSSEEGGFYSSLDADSEGEEGKYYVWTRDEIVNTLGDDAGIFNDYYNVSEEGNWEPGKNILFCNRNHEDIAGKYGISSETFREKIRHGKEKLLAYRKKRIRPGLDDKVLTSWNALMLSGYLDAYRAFGEERFLETALGNAAFLMKNAVTGNGELSRNHKNGKSSIHGFLDDYAFTISAFIGLYQSTFDEKWLDLTNTLSAYTVKHFFDEKSGMFFYTHEKHADLITRNMEISDNVIPGSNSVMARNLFVLGHYLSNESFLDKSRQMLANVADDMRRNIYYYSNWGILELQFAGKPFEVAILGEDFSSIRREMDDNYLPDVLFSGGRQEGHLDLHRKKLVPGGTLFEDGSNHFGDRRSRRGWPRQLDGPGDHDNLFQLPFSLPVPAIPNRLYGHSCCCRRGLRDRLFGRDHGRSRHSKIDPGCRHAAAGSGGLSCRLF